jgi:hypothetical protein
MEKCPSLTRKGEPCPYHEAELGSTYCTLHMKRNPKNQCQAQNTYSGRCPFREISLGLGFCGKHITQKYTGKTPHIQKFKKEVLQPQPSSVNLPFLVDHDLSFLLDFEPPKQVLDEQPVVPDSLFQVPEPTDLPGWVLD